jgi:TolB-like protein
MISLTDFLNNYSYGRIKKTDNPPLPLFSKEGVGGLGAAILLIFLVILSGCAYTKWTAGGESHTGVERFQIAVYPVENLSGTPSPLKEIRQSVINRLKTGGFSVLEEGILEKFMAKHRIRYTGGIGQGTARAFKEETGTEAVLISSVELYSDGVPPKIALIARLVSTGDKPVILWMDGVGLAGDDSPGILGLGLIEDPQELRKKAMASLLDSLIRYLSGKKGEMGVKSVKRKFSPKIVYRSPELSPDKKYSVAVVPFFNSSDRKNAGEITALHFVEALTRFENFDVIEPGVVRQGFLNLRVIMEEGVSLANADIIFSILNVDLILSGKVLDYQDYQGVLGTPKVNFSVLLIERKSRLIVWSSESYNEGDNGVFLFDWGKINTAYTMTSQMAQAIGKIMVK